MTRPTFNPNDFISDKPVTNDEIRILNEALGRTKMELFFNAQAGFLPSLVANIEFVWDRSIATACTNGVFMAWNPEFFLSLPDSSRVTVLAHEAWHIAFQHMSRGKDLDHQWYNAAADYVINNMLKEHKYDMGNFPYLLDDKYKGMSTEEVYKLLVKDKPAAAANNPQNGDFAHGSGSPDSIKGGMTAKEIDAQAKSNVIDAVTASGIGGEGIGNLPGEVKAMIEDFLKPKMSWREILLRYFTGIAEQEYSYRRPNRRYSDPILPGRTDSQGLGEIVYLVDVSGSTTDAEIVQSNSEVKGIKEAFNPEKFTLMTFDTEIRDTYVFERDDEFEKIEVTGRGGTNLVQPYEKIKEIMPQVVIVFSDMRVGFPPKIDGVDFIWICQGNPSATVPYGKLIFMDDPE